MGRPIQPSPFGLLSLLGLKQNGRNPDNFSETVSPTYDLREQYMAGQFKTLKNAAPAAMTTNVLGFFGLPVVPEGKLWWVYEHTIAIIDTVPPAAGGVITAKPAQGLYLGLPTEVFLVGLDRANYVARGPGLQRIAQATFGRPYFLRSGCTAGFYVEDCQFVGGTVLGITNIEYVEMDI